MAASKATADLREAWACNAVWYGRALAAEQLLSDAQRAQLSKATGADATLTDSIRSRCGYDRLAGMMAGISAENAVLQTKISNTIVAKERAEAETQAALRDKDAADAQVEALQSRIATLEADAKHAEAARVAHAETTRDFCFLASAHTETRTQLEALQAKMQVATSENKSLHAQVVACSAKTAADAVRRARLKSENAKLLASVKGACEAANSAAAALSQQAQQKVLDLREPRQEVGEQNTATLKLEQEPGDGAMADAWQPPAQHTHVRRQTDRQQCGGPG